MSKVIKLKKLKELSIRNWKIGQRVRAFKSRVNVESSDEEL